VGRPTGPRKVHRYSVEFKLTAVKLSSMPGVQVQMVADALDIHPFMLSRWRKEARDGIPPGPSEAGRRGAAAGARDQAPAGARARARDAPRGARPFKKSHPVLFRTKSEIFAFIESQRERFAMRRLCALYGVTRAGYYAWRIRGESARQGQDQDVLRQIRAVFESSRATYGSPRIHQALRATGTRVSRRRVERLMREAGLRARAAKLYRAIPGLHALGFVQSMNRPQEVTDNAHMESFFHSMKTDVVHGVSLASQDEVGRLLRSYIPYYNRVRLHSGLGYRSPVEYEARHA
jgi:transposase-like protein